MSKKSPKDSLKIMIDLAPIFLYQDFLTLKQHLTHTVYGDVEDGADVGSRINTTMRGDVLGKLLDGHDVGVL